MNEVIDEAVSQAREQHVKVKGGLEDAVGTVERHITLCQDYLDGKRGKHPFDDASLQKEIVEGWKMVAMLRSRINTDAETVDKLRTDLNQAIREPDHMVIELTRKDGVMSANVSPIQPRNEDSDSPDS